MTFISVTFSNKSSQELAFCVVEKVKCTFNFLSFHDYFLITAANIMSVVFFKSFYFVYLFFSSLLQLDQES